jgi:hypothetical protein
MPADQNLTKEWIRYLKNNRFAELKSDEAGNLKYKKPVTSDSVTDFLSLKTQYSDEAVSNAISMVLSRRGVKAPKLQNNPTPKEPGRDLSTWMHNEITPGTRQQTSTDVSTRNQPTASRPPKQLSAPNTVSPRKIAHDPNSVSDIEYRDVPEKPPEKKKSRFNFRSGVSEAIADTESPELDEDDIELIFKILLGGGEKYSPGDAAIAAGTPKSKPKDKVEAPPDKEKQIAEINKIKRLIRDTMSDGQRKALWRALSDA